MLGTTDTRLWHDLSPWYPCKRYARKRRQRKVAWSLDNLFLQNDRRDFVTTPPQIVSNEHRHPRFILIVVYWLSRIFGLLPYKYDGKTESLITTKCNTAYSVLCMVTLFTLWAFMTEELHTYFVQEGNVMSGLEPIILTFLNCALMALSVLRCPHLHRIVSTMSELEVELCPRGSGPSMLACVVPNLLAMLTCFVDVIASLEDSTVLDTLMYFPYYWGVIGASLVETQFSAACLSLRYWYWLLNERISSVRRRAPGAALRLEALRLSHGRLQFAACELEAAFGPQLLLDCGACFMGTVLNAYFGVNGFYDGGTETSASDVMQHTQWLWAGLYLCRISVICFASTRLGYEAMKTGRLLHALIDSRLAPDMKEEISSFSMQISTSKIEFTAWGIINIDFSLLFAIVSSTTTYLLILIQYRPK